jgi:DNA-binding NtrC family response regulator
LRTPVGQEMPGDSLASAAEVGSLAEQERLLIIRALETAGGNQSEAARVLRIGRDALRYKLKKYNLETIAVAQRVTDSD